MEDAAVVAPKFRFFLLDGAFSCHARQAGGERSVRIERAEIGGERVRGRVEAEEPHERRITRPQMAVGCCDEQRRQVFLEDVADQVRRLVDERGVWPGALRHGQLWIEPARIRAGADDRHHRVMWP